MTLAVDLGDRYTAQRRVAVGGMAEVWLAEDSETGREIAVKGPAPGLAHEIAQAALDREVSALERLDHPAIPKLVERFEVDGTPFLALEWFEGDPLSTLRGKSIEQLLPPLIGVAKALSYAHGRGVVHRDVKARNVIVDREGRPALIDFGIAACTDGEAPPIRGGGTRGHSSPQQLAGDPPQPADDLYAFGAMIEDLLAGGSLNDGPDTVPPEGGQTNARRPIHPVPDKMQTLVDELLSADPVDRPGSCAEVVQRLEEIRTEMLELTLPPLQAIDTPKAAVELKPSPRVKPQAPAAPARAERRRSSGGQWRGTGMVIVLAVVLGLGLLGVFWLLPQWVTDRPEAPPSQSVEDASPVEIDDAGADGLRALQEVDQAWRSLTERSVGLWAPERSRDVSAQLAFAREQLEDGSLSEAMETLDQVQQACVELEERAKAYVEEALADGRRHLEGGRAQAASTSFERALRVDPGASEALKGIKEARSLTEALVFFEKGAGFERSGDLAAAAEMYSKTKAKAPWFADAAWALARVQRDDRDSTYAEVLSEGLLALDSGNWATAEKTLQRAASLRPDAPEVEDALLRLRSSRRLEDIRTLQLAAEDFERREAWREAAATYEKILELAPATVSAEQGRARALERLDLDQKLAGHLAHPDRLSEPGVLNDARALMAKAASLPSKGPRLRTQLGELEVQTLRMSTPVAVEILSDAETEVIVYRVGRLGRFERRVIEVPPGIYTVVGARPGFRDVRLTLEVQPGQSPDPLTVRCKEAL